MQASVHKHVVVATMADVLHCYAVAQHGPAKKQYSLYMPCAIITLTALPAPTSRATRCVVVALANGEVRVYNDKSLVSVHGGAGCSPASGLYAGRYAREDNSLIMVTAAGGLDIKVGLLVMGARGCESA